MTQEDKNLLLKDLCARLPYGVMVEAIPYVDPQKLCYVDPIRQEYRLDFDQSHGIFLRNAVGEDYSRIKPYLRPLSSMTDEESKMYNRFIYTSHHEWDGQSTYTDYVAKSDITTYIDWLNAHHFDHRHLIEKGLALEAPEDMYKNE